MWSKIFEEEKTPVKYYPKLSDKTNARNLKRNSMICWVMGIRSKNKPV